MSEDSQIIVGCLILLVVVFLSAYIPLTVPLNIKTSVDGAHKGFITAVESNIFLADTATVYVKTDLSSSQEDQYCINGASSELVKQAKMLAESKSPVIVKYDSISLQGWAKCEGWTITSFEPSKD